MGAILVGLAAVAVGVSPASQPAPPQLAKPAAVVGGPPEVPERVGRVILVGNARTKDRAILQELPALRPGGLLPSEADLLRGEIRLLVKYHTRFDLDAGKRPFIEALPVTEGSVFRDVRVSFPENGK